KDEPVLGFVSSRQVPAGWRRVTSARDQRGRMYALVHADDARLARMAVFDAVINNADRKGGHVISTVDGRVYGVDHGVCFHAEDKLRTVLWGWVGEPLPAECVELLERLRREMAPRLGPTLAQDLTEMELGSLTMRVERLLATRCFPGPGEDWPSIPWPPI